MAIQDRNYMQRAGYETAVSSFSSRVYGWMALGLLTTAVIAFYVVHSGLFIKLLPYWWVAGIGSLGVGIAFNTMANRISFGTMGILFLTYAGLQGIFFGTTLPLYAAAAGGQAIWLAFLAAGVTFGMAVVYGLFTKTDLTRFSRIFQMALVGLITMTVVFAIASFFTDVTWMNLLISYLGLVLFVGLTAYDAQRIRKISHEVGDGVVAYKMSLMMAMRMYINVIMIFWYMLQIISSGRSR